MSVYLHALYGLALVSRLLDFKVIDDLQVGMMLRGMGFRNTTPIYLAAGKIYNEEESMEPLRRMFPYLQTKETLLTREEFKPFKVNMFFELGGNNRHYY